LKLRAHIPPFVPEKLPGTNVIFVHLTCKWEWNFHSKRFWPARLAQIRPAPVIGQIKNKLNEVLCM
jgi:hypothetical protein